MAGLATNDQAVDLGKGLTSRADVTGFFMQLCDEIGAGSYMLVAVVSGHERPELRIIASNWVYDAIRLIGHEFIINLVESGLTVPPGGRASSLECSRSPDMPELISGEQARLLDVLGHAEIFSLRVHVGRRRYFVLFSAAEADSIDAERLPRAQMLATYALSQVPEILAAAAMQNPLSERERECLYWVSSGKTTDDVAMILGVSSNTVNSYVTHAIRKFQAKNRAMAMATAIRSGII
ncbi:LuxR C-terminal-related transcriptional regulator [Mesorhizobium sp. BAC0120]|uniref:helix-turn-helix transcriptional regulator n=1 Tax=Mesorhizobium sp. BAC0120 TaxID=3090670 RepID=UPI00298BC99C|nr:LuxR C-terminal-related transcriptional regulator [Mesorhizobium sp. BAC0120]MDW6024459.1 LuxR C-terminal-related transcriptional regulator [Mesorhizobium sp. BAC0120]